MPPSAASIIEPEEEEEEEEDEMKDSVGWEYLGPIFDLNRLGFSEIAENILHHLDYKSLVNFKVTCKTIYNFIRSSNIELMKERRKLHLDWKLGVAKQLSFNVPGLVGCAKIYDGGRKIVVGVDQRLQFFTRDQSEAVLTLNGLKSPICCIDVNEDDPQGTIVVTGAADGIFTMWNSETGEILVEKQLFGRIEAIKWKGSRLVTAHFGKAFGAGCITVREYRSPTDMPVILSRYEDLFPIFSMDTNDKFIAALEWSGTFNNVHGGTVNLYKASDLSFLVNLSQLTDCYNYTCCRFLGEDFLLTGGHNRLIHVWSLVDGRVHLIRRLSGHDGIIVRLEVDPESQRGVSRDICGGIIVWDLSNYEKSEIKYEDEKLLRRIESLSKTVTCIALDKRQLVMGSIGNFNVFDFWNTVKT